jgi:hypothetical protein
MTASCLFDDFLLELLPGGMAKNGPNAPIRQPILASANSLDIAGL